MCRGNKICQLAVPPEIEGEAPIPLSEYTQRDQGVVLYKTCQANYAVSCPGSEGRQPLPRGEPGGPPPTGASGDAGGARSKDLFSLSHTVDEWEVSGDTHSERHLSPVGTQGAYDKL